MKTSELSGAALDWAVAKCEGRAFEDPDSFLAYYDEGGMHYAYDWAQGGPIIERESIRVTPDQGETYVNCVWFAGSANEDGDEFNGEGPTPLIAAMRCYVASKLGGTVDIPKELTE